MSETKRLGFSTRALHEGYDPKEHNGARVPPLYQTTAYLFNDAEHAAKLFKLEEAGYIYTRLNNPTVDVLEKRIASLEGGLAGLAFASGMAAISGTILTLLRPGDEIVSSSSLYGGTYNLFSVTLPKMGIKTRFVNLSEPDGFKAAINKNTKALYAETIGNPKIDVPDFDALAKIAREAEIPFIVDNTTASPYLCRPLELGANLVIHSASKFIGGHGNSLGGLVVEGAGFEWLRRFPHLEPYKDFPVPFSVCARVEILRDYGAALAPLNALLLIQGLETLSLRMERHSQNALAVARYLAGRKEVSYVNYPGLEESPSNALAKKYLPKGCGALLSFGVKGGYEAGKKLVDSVGFIHHLANLGDTKTLVLHPASTSHEQLKPEERTAAGAPDELIRMSIGLEDVEDIIADIERGF